MFVSKKLVTETCAAAEVYSVGPVDGALHQEMIQNCGGMWTIAQNKSVCARVCEGERERESWRKGKIEQERWKACMYLGVCVIKRRRRRE